MSDSGSFGIGRAGGSTLGGTTPPALRNARTELADRVVKPTVSAPPSPQTQAPDAAALQGAADAYAERNAFIADLRARLGAPVTMVETLPDSAVLARSRESANARRGAQAYGSNQLGEQKSASPLSYLPRPRSTEDDQRI